MGISCLCLCRRDQQGCIADGIAHTRSIVSQPLGFSYVFVVRVILVIKHFIMIIQNTGTAQSKPPRMGYGRPPASLIVGSHYRRTIFIITRITMRKRIPFHLIAKIVLIVIVSSP